jgi:hypothetical protein
MMMMMMRAAAAASRSDLYPAFRLCICVRELQCVRVSR